MPELLLGYRAKQKKTIKIYDKNCLSGVKGFNEFFLLHYYFKVKRSQRNSIAMKQKFWFKRKEEREKKLFPIVT